MAFGHGKDAIFKLDTVGDVLTDISAYITSVNPSFSVDSAEVTTISKSSKVYIAGLRDGTISLDGIYDPTIDTLFEGILGESGQNFEYGPQGGDGGSIKYSGECMLTSYDLKTGLDGAVSFSANLQISGDVTKGTF